MLSADRTRLAEISRTRWPDHACEGEPRISYYEDALRCGDDEHCDPAQCQLGPIPSGHVSLPGPLRADPSLFVCTRVSGEALLAKSPILGSGPSNFSKCRAFFEEWSKLDLRSMGKKRDEFPSLAEEYVAKEKLGAWYDVIYAQFSSVSHYDRYSLELLTINKTPTGKPYLGAPSHWPKMLILQNTNFDIIQCFEAAHVCHKVDAAPIFNAFYVEWVHLAKVLAPEMEELARS